MRPLERHTPSLFYLGNLLRRSPLLSVYQGPMHIAYLDESGDLGAAGSPSRLFILSAILIPHERWLEATLFLDQLREDLGIRYGLRPAAEIHASEFLGGSPLHLGLDVPRRFQCAHHLLRSLVGTDLMMPVRIAVRKGDKGGRQLLDAAWDGLWKQVNQEIVLAPKSSCGGRGLLVVIDHHGASPYRPTNKRNLRDPCPLLELPFGRRSEDSQFLQCADLLGFLTKQSLDPNRYFSGSRGKRLLRLSETLHRKPCPIVLPQ